MSTRSWFTHLFGLASRSSRSRRPRGTLPPGSNRPRLALEALEERQAPATLTVNSMADTASGSDTYLSLREATIIVNSPTLPTGLSAQIRAQISGTLHAGGMDSIVFDHTQVTTPIFLVGGQLELGLPSSTARVTIDGGSGITLDGVRQSRRLLVDSGVQATLAHLTLTNGGGDGAGIFNDGGTLTVSNSTLESNTANFDGGAIFNNGGTLTVTGSTLSFNNGGSYGGAISNRETPSSRASCTVSNSILSSNSVTYNGGAIYSNGNNTVTVSNCTLMSNSSDFSASGIYNIGGTLTVTNSTLSSNSAGNSGGGIGSDSGTVTVSNSTLSANSAGNGGGISNGGTLTVSNSTLTANSASGFGGGGISNSGTLTVTNTTLSSNSATQGGGIFLASGTLRLQNTIVAGNQSSGINSGPDINGMVSSTSSSNNLVGSSDSTLTGINNGTGGNLVGSAISSIDPRLGPLANNGGPTWTHALLPDSPARGAGSLAYAAATDQRGLPRVVSGQIDLGAYQSQTAVAGPQVVVSDPSGVVDPPVNHVRLTFNHPMDPTSVTTAQFSLSGPGGTVALTGVTAVASTNNQQFDVSFASQSQPGDYALVVGAAVRDIYGTTQGSPFTDRFTLFGLTGSILTVNSSADTANPTDPYLSLREAIAIVNSPTLPSGLSAQIRAQISGTLHAHGSDAIVFDHTRVTTPITLGGTQLELSLNSSTARITIDGGSGITVDGNNASRVFQVDFGVRGTLDHLTITHGTTFNGGGITNSGTLTVNHSTLSSNFATTGSGIYNDIGMLTLSNSTLSSNSARQGGGGIYNNSGTLTVTNTTLSSNSATQGGGIFLASGTLRLQNTIVAGNQSSGINSGPDINGMVSSTSSSNNLVGSSDSTLTGINNGTGGNLVGSAISSIDPRLGPLANNGGPTWTHALLPDSPARGAGSLAYAAATDQRGLPRVVSGQIDLGAYQSQTAVAGPQVVVSDPSGVVDPPVNHVRLTFNHPMDPTSVTTAQFSLSGPGGTVALTGVTAVASTNNQQFDVSFASQSQPGDYALVVGAAVRDIYGTTQGSPFTDRFTLFGLTGSILTVNSSADTANPTDPYLSLREAIAIVNSPTLPSGLSAQIRAQISGTLHAHGSDSIVFDHTRVTTAITLGGTQLELSLNSSTARITIDGGSGITVDGNNASRVFQVDFGARCTVDHLTITHGISGNGGGIINSGTLTVNHSTLSSNSATTGSGGGIYNSGGTVTVSNSTLASNVATAGPFAGSSGGGISNGSGTLIVSNSTITFNTAGGRFATGGGISNAGTLTLSDSTLSFNSASAPSSSGGGISNSGTATVSNSTLSSNSSSGLSSAGGGILNSGTLTVSNSTLSSNSAGAGGGIDTINGGTLLVTNSTLSSNLATQGGGISLSSNSTLRLQNTIVAGNSSSSPNRGPDINGAVDSSSSYNLVGIQDGTLTGISNGVNHNQIGTTASPIDPRLGPLANNGGPTQTRALLAGSPAIGTGDPAQAGTPDQRGVIRGTPVSIGAYQAAAASSSTATALSASAATSVYGQSVTFTATVTSGGSPVTVGSVTFTDGSTTLSTVNVNGSGQAAYSTTALTVAGSPHTITATYNPSGSYLPSSGSTTLTVTRAALTITADGKAKVYGSANPNLTASYSGFVNGDTSAVVSGLVLTTTATMGSGVGAYPITGSGASAANYSIRYVNGTLTVTPAALTITADDKTRPFGSANPPLTATYSGFVNGDTPASLTGTLMLSTTATMSSPPGTYPITVSGQTSNNYTIHYVNGTLTVVSGVASSTTTLTSSGSPSVYGHSVTFTATVTSNSAPLAGVSVAFSEGSTALGSRTTDALGHATYTTSALVAGSHTLTATYSGSPEITGSSGNFTQTVNRASLTITADNKTRVYAQANPPLTAHYTGFVNGDTSASLTTQPTLTTTATAASPVGHYPITPSGAAARNYTIHYVSATLTVTPARLTATGQAIASFAGAPFSGLVAFFTNADPFGNPGSYRATITWGDGTTSAGTITDAGHGVFHVSGSHTYAHPHSYTVRVQISHRLGDTTSATTSSTATVTTLGADPEAGQTRRIAFWHRGRGQALIASFQGDENSTALARWLATTFPRLYGSAAGSHNLTGRTNVQVAAFYQSLWAEQADNPDVQVLATALNLYATTESLGGTAGQAYGFLVSAEGLGAASFNVDDAGAAFGVEDGTILNVYELLQAVNRRAGHGVLYHGNAELRELCEDLFERLNRAGQ